MGTGRNFLDLPAELADPRSARYAVLPVPYEATVSYAKGTAAGPQAIIEASWQVEYLDEELGIEFARAGVATCEPVAPADSPDEQMRRVRAAAEPIVRAGKFLLTLGGEHSITAPIVSAVADHHGEISVLQLDAHADLRDSYEGTRHSHACVMRRMVAEDADWIDKALALLGRKVYVTVDVDVFDPAAAPGVGTPEPGGLGWYSVLSLLRRVCAEREVVAADVVETRPIPPSNVTEFLAARLACKIIAYTQA